MSITRNADFYAVWLQSFLGYGSTAVREMLSAGVQPEALYEFSTKQLQDTGWFTAGEIKRRGRMDEWFIRSTLQYCNENEIRVLFPGHAEYPIGFDDLEAPPAALYARGCFLEADAPYVSIVGCRKSTELGEKSAYSLAARLARSGLTVVSGGALGIDSMAHVGALNAGGKTVMFLGCGIDSSYLSCQLPLRRRTEQNGTLLSEFPPRSSAGKGNFPVRNRLIAAMSDVTAVVEAGEKSGALITASRAMELGRAVFAMPGSIAAPTFVGNNTLIRDGAFPLLSVQDILSVYTVSFGDRLNSDNMLSPAIKAGFHDAPGRSKKPTTETTGSKTGKSKATLTANKKPQCASVNRPAQKQAVTGCSEQAQKIYAAFEQEIEISDILSDRSGLRGGAFLAAVTELELRGYITAVPVGRYRLKNIQK